MLMLILTMWGKELARERWRRREGRIELLQPENNKVVSN